VHGAVVGVDAPALAMSGVEGQLHGVAIDGFYDQERCLLSRLVLRIGDREPEPVGGDPVGGPTTRFVGIVRADADGADPTVIVERIRRSFPAGESIRITNAGRVSVDLPVEIAAGSDLAEMGQVRRGQRPAEIAAEAIRDGWRWVSPSDGLAVTLEVTKSPENVDRNTGVMDWTVNLAPGEEWTVDLHITAKAAADHPVTVAAPAVPAPWRVPRVRCSDSRLPDLVRQSLLDIDALLLADPAQTSDLFLAAGSPWFLTLFGRDSLWAARMLLPLGTELAAGTLRTLARRQGTRYDPETEEAPGKIMHELRPEGHTSTFLPPRYYGTIDATPLFVTLLAEAWRWGLPEAEVAELLPAAERALHWLSTDADADGDGFIEYRQSGTRGLANQGWKDSGDAVQFADGRLAEPPIALCEVQGYAYEAAIRGAELLDAFHRPDADRWREWAATLRRRFRSSFWATDDIGPYPAIALDAEKNQVDGVASNMGHLLGTGILDPEECGLVAERIGSPAMDCGWGLRTLSADSRGFNPFSYHCGTVWPHDTAITIAGLAATGHHEQAASLLSGLVRAAPSFDYRLPELFAGEQHATGRAPLAYPSACRPQAWAATAGISILQSLLGLRPDVPGGAVVVAPLQPAPYATVEVHNLTVAGKPFSARIDDGTISVSAIAPGLDLHVDK
jgi:glycogen debranching enzyme